MLGHDYFYNANLKKAVAIFGAVFNDLAIAKKAVGSELNSYQRVPLAYGPRDKFLARVNKEGDRSEHIAIKMPRMSFEISDISYDSVNKRNPLNRNIQVQDGEQVRVREAVPYNMSMSLYILSRSQGEALQILEQILPFFQPSFTVTAKGMEGPDSRTDIPITLKSTSHEDTYAGALDQRRNVIYTLEFGMKIKLLGPVQTGNIGIIKAIDVNMLDLDTEALFSGVEVRTALQSQTEDDYELVENLGTILDPDRTVWPAE